MKGGNLHIDNMVFLPCHAETQGRKYLKRKENVI